MVVATFSKVLALDWKLLRVWWCICLVWPGMAYVPYALTIDELGQVNSFIEFLVFFKRTAPQHSDNEFALHSAPIHATEVSFGAPSLTRSTTSTTKSVTTN